MPLRMMNYRLLTRGRLRLVLKGIESQLCLRSDGMTELDPVSKNMTIEHILPVEWKKDAWPLPEGVDEEKAIVSAPTYSNTIGNLTLVTNKLNSSMFNNSPWAHKREALRKYSSYRLNNEILSELSWDEKTIKSQSDWQNWCQKDGRVLVRMCVTSNWWQCYSPRWGWKLEWNIR